MTTAQLDPPSSPTIGLDYALQRYERWRTSESDASPRTWAGEKSSLLGFVDTMHRQGKHDPSSIDHEDVAIWWARQRHLAESTRATRLHQVRSFLVYCAKRSWAQGDPSSLISAHRPAPEVRERLTPDELLMLVEAASDHSERDRICLALAVNLAIRGGEIGRLRLRDVDLDTGIIRVRITKTNEVDEMPITLDLHRELVRWQHRYAAACKELTRDSFLVPSVYRSPLCEIIYRHDRPFSEPHKAVQRALERLGWESTRQEGVHTVRRSVARILFDDVEASESFDSALLVVMSLLHHARSETTLAYIGRDRQTMARDKILRGEPFLTRLAKDTSVLRLA